MRFNPLLAALFSMTASSFPRVAPEYMPKVHRTGRSRTPGKRGVAGDKLARIAYEGRVGLRF